MFGESRMTSQGLQIVYIALGFRISDLLPNFHPVNPNSYSVMGSTYKPQGSFSHSVGNLGYGTSQHFHQLNLSQEQAFTAISFC